MTGYDIYDAGFEEGVEAALDYIEAMEQMNPDKLSRKQAKAEGYAIAKAYGKAHGGIGNVNINQIPRSKEGKDICIGGAVAHRMHKPDGHYMSDPSDRAKADRLARQMTKRNPGASFETDPSGRNARGYAFSRAVGRKAAYDLGIKTHDDPSPVYGSKKEELTARLKDTKRYQQAKSKKSVESAFDFSDFEDGFIDFMAEDYYDDYYDM